MARYETYGNPEPYVSPYPYVPAMGEHGRNHAIIGYGYEYHNAQRYVEQTEQVVEFRHGGDGRNYRLNGDNNKPHVAPWNPAPDWPENGHHESSHDHGISEKPKGGGSPRYNTYKYNPSPKRSEKPKGGSPPQYSAYKSPLPHPKRDHTTYNENHSSDEDEADESDEEVCNDGVCYPKHKGYGAKPNSHFEVDGYDRPGTKFVRNPPYSQPTKVPNHDKYNQKPKGTNYAQPSYYEPSYEPSYEPTHNRPLPAVKTNPADHTGRVPEYANNSPHNSPGEKQPKFNVNRKGYPDTINSSEAKKRYGGVAVPTNKYSQQEYKGTIDCKTAAEKYHGIFVPGNNY